MISAFEQYFESLKGRKIAVMGLGVSNRPLVRLLLGYGCTGTGCDRTPREKLDAEVLELENMGCKLSVGDGYLDDIQAELVFRTPGMHPGNPAIEILRAKGAKITSEMEGFFELCRCMVLNFCLLWLVCRSCHLKEHGARQRRWKIGKAGNGEIWEK